MKCKKYACQRPLLHFYGAMYNTPTSVQFRVKTCSKFLTCHKYKLCFKRHPGKTSMSLCQRLKSAIPPILTLFAYSYPMEKCHWINPSPPPLLPSPPIHEHTPLVSLCKKTHTLCCNALFTVTVKFTVLYHRRYAEECWDN